ncbi:MAG: hypothetical protein KC415_00620 [Anaerolineales bacterium]|nr:hypothetical protein [Anaerolineales bacterium]MCB8989988.1 hypothetical protein [Ardenticatenaceae bacterium]
MKQIVLRIVVGLGVGLVSAVGSYIVGAVVTPMFICCPESNIFLGLLFTGPLMALIGGGAGFLLGYNLTYLRHFAAIWHESHKFKGVVVIFAILVLLWFMVLLAIMSESFLN